MIFNKNKQKGSDEPKGSTGGAMKIGSDEAEIAGLLARAGWYRDQFRNSWKLIFGLCALLAISVIGNLTQLAMRERPQNYAVTPDLRVIPLTPLTEASLSPEAVRQWATRLVGQAYGLNYQDYRQQLANLKQEFTESGYEGFMQSLERSKLIELIVSENYVVSAVVKETPTIVKSGKLKGGYAWRISVPVVVTYRNGAGATTQDLVVTLLAVRVAESRNMTGIAVQNFIAGRSSR